MVRKCVLGSLAVAALLCVAFENQAEATCRRRCCRRSRSDCCYGQSYAYSGGYYGNGSSYYSNGYSSQRYGYVNQCCYPSGAGTTANYPPAAGGYAPDGTYRDGALAPQPSDAPPPPAPVESRSQGRAP